MAASADSESAAAFNLELVRQSLERQEDTIVFCLIERAKFPSNSPLYNQTLNLVPGFSGSLLHFIVKETEALHSKAGRYENPEENPFFSDNLPASVVPPHNYPKFLHLPAASVDVNKQIWDMYFNQLLPLYVAEGDDGNYAPTAANDLDCLQALSRRIHYGKFVAEVKFREAPQQYEPAIRVEDRDALMNMLTFKSVEETVKKRVAKKAMVFGQNVTLGNNTSNSDSNSNSTSTITTTEKYKVDPSILSRLYDEWVMPLTKLVEVEYLLRRLD